MVMKRTLMSLVVGVVLCGLTFLLLTNSHSDIFPCTEYEVLPPHRSSVGMRPRRQSGTCSLMEVQRDRPDQSPKLTGGGYALAGLVHALAFAVGAGGVLLATRRRDGMSGDGARA